MSDLAPHPTGTDLREPLGRVRDAFDRNDREGAVAAARELVRLSASDSVERAYGLAYLSRSIPPRRTACREALELAIQARALVDLLPPRRQVELHQVLTIAWYGVGDRAKSLEASLSALDAASRTSDHGLTLLALNNVGYHYIITGEPERARDYYERALALGIDDQAMLALVHRNRSQVNIDVGRLDEATADAERALSLAREVDDELVVHYAAYSLAQIARLREDRAEAIAGYERLLASGFDDGYLRDFCWAELADCHRLDGDVERAVACLERSLDESRDEPEPLATMQCHEQLATMYKLAGRFEDGLRSLELAFRLHRQVFDERNEAQVRALEVEHRFDALRSESELLHRQNAELARLNEVITELSTRDELTGLSNRRHLFERAAVLGETARRYRRPLTVAMIDIDHFKVVNDTYGHGVGDEVIRGVAETLSAQVRASDLVARYGGEEFVVVMPETSIDAATTACERLRAAVEASSWPYPDLCVRVSIGVSQQTAGETWDELLAAADRSLYEAKGSGRNRVCAAPRPGSRARLTTAAAS